MSREYSEEMKPTKGGSNSKNRILANNWVENPYQDVAEPNKIKPNSFYTKKQFFAHTDNNLKGISNLAKDEDLIV